MKLLFLGTASGLVSDAENFQSNMLLLADNGKKLLIDCGTDIRFSLTKAQYSYQHIDAVYISHLHADHAGGMEWLALQRKFASDLNKPELIVHNELLQALWDNSLSGGLMTLDEKEATLHDFFHVRNANSKQIIHWEGLQLQLIKTVHFHSNHQLMPSFGLNITYQEKSYLITTDTQFTPEYFAEYYQNAALIFHDCETLEVASGVHAHFTQLMGLPEEIKAKMWLYHYNDGALPDAQAAGFCGFVRRGQVIDLI